MKNRYVTLWLFLILILCLFPPVSTKNIIYEGHMFIGNVGVHISRPTGGWIEGQIVWTRLGFEALIISLFVLLLRSIGTFERILSRNPRREGCRNVIGILSKLKVATRLIVIPSFFSIIGLILIGYAFDQSIGNWGYLGFIPFFTGVLTLLSNFEKFRNIIR